MDWKEALEGLRELIDPLCTDTQFDYEQEIEKAIEAVEKQIEKPVRITTSTKRCGRCGRQLSGKGNLHPERIYCTKCGQKIEWR